MFSSFSGGKKFNDLSIFKKMSKLEELNLFCSQGLTDSSFSVFSEDDVFPNLRRLNVGWCFSLSQKGLFDHLARNRNCCHELKELIVVNSFTRSWTEVVEDDETGETPLADAIKSLCRLKGLRRLQGVPKYFEIDLKKELKNLEEFM